MKNININAILCRVNQPDRTKGKLFDLKGNDWTTVEKPWLNNAPNISCIPDGVYPFVKEWSPHAQEMRIELKLVHNRSEIQVHSGNDPKHVLGCIANGTKAQEKAFYDAMPDMGFIQVVTIK